MKVIATIDDLKYELHESTMLILTDYIDNKLQTFGKYFWWKDTDHIRRSDKSSSIKMHNITPERFMEAANALGLTVILLSEWEWKATQE